MLIYVFYFAQPQQSQKADQLIAANSEVGVYPLGYIQCS